MSRRTLPGTFALAIAGCAAALMAGSATASSTQLDSASALAGRIVGTFTIQFPKGHAASNAPCPPDAFCGVGTLAGYGAATITIVEDSFDEIPGSPCLATTRLERLDLLDGGGSLVLESAGTFCRPGGSGDSRASDASYGFPGRFELRFNVVGSESTGVFDGASGSGAEEMRVDGGSGVWQLDGTLGRATGEGHVCAVAQRQAWQ